MICERCGNAIEKIVTVQPQDADNKFAVLFTPQRIVIDGTGASMYWPATVCTQCQTDIAEGSTLPIDHATPQPFEADS